MRVTKYRPIKTTSTLDKVFDNFFGTQLSELVGGEFTASTPSANISEHPDGYYIELAIPGLKKEDVDIQVEKNILIIKATSEKEDVTYDRREFNYTSFERRFFLSDDIDQEKIAAKHELGVLTITLVKKTEVETKKTVSIQ